MNQFKFIYILSLIFLVVSCKSEKLSEEKLLQYLNEEDHGLIKKEEFKDTYTEVIYKPTDLIIYQNYKNQIRSKGTYDSLEKEISKYIYFTMRISKNNRDIESSHALQSDYQQLISYLNYYMQDDICMEVKGKKFPPVAYVYVPMFGSTQATSILFAFERKSIEDTDNLTIRFDGIKLKGGLSKFNFKTKDILNTPKIELNFK